MSVRWGKLGALAVAVACAGCADGAERASGSRQLVIGGKLSPEADDGVVLLRTDRAKGTSVCSASLLAPNLVVTARHCIVADYPADNIHCNADGTLELPSGGQLGDPASPANVNVFTGAEVQSSDGILPDGDPAALGAQIITTTWPVVCRDDIALVVLDRALSQPILTFDLQKKVSGSEEVSVVGYGLTESSGTDDRYSARHRRDGLRVKYVGTLPNTFVLPRSVCKGDSGGPALDPVTGAVLGVYSLGFPGDDAVACTSETALNYFVQVNRYEELLREAFDAAGQPFPEPMSDGGAGGMGGAEIGAGAPSTGASDAGGASGATDAGATSSAGTVGGASGEATGGKTAPRKPDNDGCQVRVGVAPTSSSQLSSLGLLLGFVWRRRRRRSA